MATDGLAAAPLIAAQAASAAEPNICVAAGGEQRVQKGTTDCDADGTGSVAIARAAGSQAYATGGDFNRATASGDGSYADAGGGDDNTASATTDGCSVLAFGGGVTATC